MEITIKDGTVCFHMHETDIHLPFWYATIASSNLKSSFAASVHVDGEKFGTIEPFDSIGDALVHIQNAALKTADKNASAGLMTFVRCFRIA